MPQGAASSQGSGGEFISHITGIRMRILGDGDLLMRLLTQSEVRSQTLVPFTMSESTEVSPIRLANFTTQRAQLEFKTEELDDYFEITRIIFFIRRVASEYPG